MPLPELTRRALLLPLLASTALAACGDRADNEAAGSDDNAVETETELEPAIETDDVTVYFPRQAENPGIDFDDQPAPGQLTLDEQGCLRMNEAGPVVIWPYTGFAIEHTGDTIKLVNEDEDYVVAHEGDDVSLHGTPIDAQHLDEVNLEHPLPEVCADAGQYLVTGPSISQADEDETAWIQEARDRFEDGQDQLTSVNIPDRYGVQINGEDFIVLETTTFEADGHYQEITSLISSGQWEELEQFGELTDEAQDLIEDGEVETLLKEHDLYQEPD